MYVLAFSPGTNNITSVVLFRIKKYYHLSNPYNVSHHHYLILFFLIITFLSFIYFGISDKVIKSKKLLK